MSDNQLGFLGTKEEEFSRFFLQEDSLRALDIELSVTLNKRYKCNAGCKMCYLSNQWIEHKDFQPIGKYTEENLTTEWEETFFDFASNFKIVSTIDDMRYLKKYFPKQYNFYKENSEFFSLSSISDQSLFYHFPIITQEMRFKDIYELTFSDRFLTKNIRKIKTMLEEVTDRYQIGQVKIVNGDLPLSINESKKVRDFVKFLLDKGVQTYYHHDINHEWKQVKDAAHAFYSENSQPYPVLNQVTFLAFEDIYLELSDFTSKDNAFKVGCMYELHDFSDLLPKVLQTKLDIYKNNATTLLNKDSHYTKYFKSCADSFIINQEFNFIPYILLRDYAVWYNKLIEAGDWLDVGPGLLKKDSHEILSIIEVKK